MKGYIAKRIVYTLITLFIIASLTFVIFQVVSPIDPRTLFLGKKKIIDPILIEEITKRFGLNEPIHIRYFKYIINTFTFNFGYSFRTSMPVAYEISCRLWPTILLMALAMGGTALLGIPLGALAASRRGSKIDIFATGAGLLTWGVPLYFIQLLFLIFFSLYLRWFPVSGIVDVKNLPPFPSFDFVAQVAHHLALPLVTMMVSGFGSWALYTRNLMLDVLTEDYIVTARAKGMSEGKVIFRHAFRATLPPLVTMFVLSIPMVFWGVIVTEIVFAFPGIGNLFLESTLQADWPVIQALIFLFAIILTVGNLLADFLYGFVDPRIRVGARK